MRRTANSSSFLLAARARHAHRLIFISSFLLSFFLFFFFRIYSPCNFARFSFRVPREFCGSLEVLRVFKTNACLLIFMTGLNALAGCADTNTPATGRLSATYSSRYTARKIILILKWRIIRRDVFNDAPYTRSVPETARCTLVLQKIV